MAGDALMSYLLDQLERWVASRREACVRPSRSEYFLAIAVLASSRSTCARAARGCVLVSREGHVLATGYNGVPPSRSHCLQDPGARCAGADAASGQQLDQCDATHAEANALVQCSESRRIATCYSTVSPCVNCVKMLLATGCVTIVFRQAYADEPTARALWLGNDSSREWIEIS